MAVSARDVSEYEERDIVPIRRALISVSDKTGLLDFARVLSDAGVEIVSTGSTAQTIADEGIAVTEVAEITGFPESLDGRVKTLHPKIHGGILADLRLKGHRQQLDGLGIEPFELVVVNLYPFRETVQSGADALTVVENIDIGGPAMVRAAAKNHPNVAVVVNPDFYPLIAQAIQNGGTTLELRQQLAGAAFQHTAEYDTAVSGWFSNNLPKIDWVISHSSQAQPENSGATEFVGSINVSAELVAGLRYGENSHQAAAIYAIEGGTGITQATLLGGKAMSYNNYVDADAALRAAYDHSDPAVAIIKHANPCGIAVGTDIADAHAKAHECDPVSAFGGVIAANRTVTAAAAKQIKDIFTEVLVAPGFESEALEILSTKKNLRLLQLPENYRREPAEIRQVSGGLLVQQPDLVDAEGDNPANWQLASGEPASAEVLADLEFAWRSVRAVKSNAILLAKNGASVGVGMGQVNRVDSCGLAVSRAGDRARGSVAASDAFFPFADGLQVLLDAGVTAVVQPGGSVRDEEVIAAAKAAGVTMYFTGTRHFFH